MVTATAALAGRNITRIRRNSGSMISATVIPGIFLVALYAVFSTAMEANGIDYAQYLVPANTLQAILFTAGGSAMAIGVDQATGINDRLRASPVPTAAPVVGRLLADLVRAVASVAVVTALGVLLGFRWRGGVLDLLMYLLIILGVAVAVSLLYDGIALLASSPESAAGILQAVSIPVLMISTSFVPAGSLPSGAAPVIEALPVSVVGEVLRQASTGTVRPGTLIGAVAWIVGLAVAGAVLSARAFRRQS
ncbi:MAG: ABC transporter permease [Corynebacterium nuruki]|jgi:ABC-2 type transport system permease protein|nr:ABC transporter permease [Corynebacterium nuruki]